MCLWNQYDSPDYYHAVGTYQENIFCDLSKVGQNGIL